MCSLNTLRISKCFFEKENDYHPVWENLVKKLLEFLSKEKVVEGYKTKSESIDINTLYNLYFFFFLNKLFTQSK